MRDDKLLTALFFTTSLFLVHCSSGDDDSSKGTGSAGKSTPVAGTTSTAGKSGSGGSAGTGGAGGSAAGLSGGSGGGGRGGAGAGGMTAGQGGLAGSAAGGAAGGAGRGAAGAAGANVGGAGASGAGGSAGTPAGASGDAGRGPGGMGGMSTSGGFTLTSSVITEGGMFPDGNTCAGANKSPDLTWTAGPTGTMSYAVILLDTNNSLNHWVMWDIPASVTTLAAGLDTAAMPAVPAGAKQKSFNGTGYTGPCPGSMGPHVYKFTVYAISTATLAGAMASDSTMNLSMDIMSSNPLASASLSSSSSASMN